MTAAAPVQQPTRRSAPHGAAAAPRSFGWVGAMVLLVLLAAAGLPAAGASLLVAEPVAARSEACGDRVLGVAAPAPRRAALPVAKAIVPWPRALPRTRSVQRRGLPPPRAPTA